jgi:cation diffusion facilitator CzcD-associated flavoprotein CzcO
MQHAETIIIGAGPAGLACAAALQQAGLPAIVLEKSDKVGASWRRHYDRLHLHTPRKQSGLLGLPMPASFPTYPARDQVVAYLEDYAAHHRIAPRFGTPAMRITRPDKWLIETSGEAFTAANVIIASGIAGWPQRADWPGQDSFGGRLLHSSEYANAMPFASQRVLVVGFGNSGGEIAMDLANAGIDVSVSVRSPVNILPRELFGMSMMTWAILQRPLPYRLMDALNTPLLRLVIGDLAKLGLRKSPKGPLAQIIEDRKIPVLDIGTVDLIRGGKIKVRAGVERIARPQVEFADGTTAPFDVIIEATGYRPDLRSLLPDHLDALDESFGPKICGGPTAYPGLFFCGHIPVATGQLREIGIEARRIASLI